MHQGTGTLTPAACLRLVQGLARLPLNRRHHGRPWNAQMGASLTSPEGQYLCFFAEANLPCICIVWLESCVQLLAKYSPAWLLQIQKD